MGASSSIIKRVPMEEKGMTLYKKLRCGCIYISSYDDSEGYYLYLLFGCISCMKNIQNNRADRYIKILREVSDEFENYPNQVLIDRFDWMTTSKIVCYLHENRIYTNDLNETREIIRHFDLPVLSIVKKDFMSISPPL